MVTGTREGSACLLHLVLYKSTIVRLKIIEARWKASKERFTWNQFFGDLVQVFMGKRQF